MATSQAEIVQAYIDETKDTAMQAVDDLKMASMNSFDVFWNYHNGNIQSGLDFTNVLFDYQPPVLPDIPVFDSSDVVYEEVATEAHNTYVWSSAGDAKIKEAIWNTVYNQGIGLSQELQDSIFQSDRERKLLALSDSIMMINARTGAKGFNYPVSITKAQENEVILKYQYDLENQSREITKLMEEHARVNIQFAIQQGIAVENFHADFTTKYDQLFLEMIKTSVELYVARIKADIDAYEAYIKGVVAKAEVVMLNAKYLATVGSVMLDKYKTDVAQEAHKTQLAFNVSSTNLSNTLSALDGYAKTAAGIIQAASNNYISVSTSKEESL